MYLLLVTKEGKVSFVRVPGDFCRPVFKKVRQREQVVVNATKPETEWIEFVRVPAFFGARALFDEPVLLYEEQ